MGGAGTKLRKHLQRGDEYAALQLCERHPELRKSLDPNSSYGEQYGHNTPLHFASKHCMKALIRLFLNDLGGNPNKKNGDEATAVSLICQGRTRLSMSPNLDAKHRAECLILFLAWEGIAMANGDKERADLDAVDAKSNTALHYAAASGLKRCVEMLVCRGAKLTIENCAKETPCDSAERCGYRDIAEFLESKMVFSAEHQDDVNEDDMVFPASERFNGLREQDLIEAKDMLLVETSDMLRVPLFTAEALLRNHEWSRDALWSSWNRDPVSCCEKCGVQPPESARECLTSSKEGMSTTTDTPLSGSVHDHSTSSSHGSPDHGEPDIVCEICCSKMTMATEAVTNGECGHLFCRMCWKQYASVKIQEGDLHSISCPAFSCSKLVPLDLIEQVVSPSMARKYLKFDIKAFVESNPSIKWCPFPGCTNAVRLPDLDDEIPMYLRAFPKIQPPPPTSKTVYCPQGHAFCWDCLMEGHEPTCCAKWKEWHDKIAEVKPEALADTGSASEAAANCLWLVTHSKPCPKCKSPIQKNEGCNHMKCSKCKHDFCWVCLGQWKKHSTETGGYFRCNRYDDSRKVEEKTEQAIAEAKEQSRRAQELNRFVHYYSRFKNHLNSFDWERSLFDKVEEKVELLAKSADTTSTETEEPIDFSFVNQAIQELLRSRKVLSSSYGYGYFLKDCGYNKTIFEYLQNELEVSVETLSGLVGRSYLRGSRSRIIKTTQLVASRRQRFLLCISRGLVPPETPPNLRKNRRGRHLPAILGLDKDDDDWVKSGMPPVEDLDPSRPWVKDSRGRHHNLLAILDWPDEEGSDEEAVGAASPSDDYSLCERKSCTRARVRNPRTGELHLYCSPKCQYLDNAMDGDSGEPGSARQYNVDLMIALQMSRIQLLQDLKVLCDEDEDDVPGPSGAKQRPVADNGYLGEDIDPDLQLAIHRSVSESCSWLPTEENSADTSTVHRFLKSLADKSSSVESSNLLNEDPDLTGNLPLDPKCDKILLQEVAGKKDD